MRITLSQLQASTVIQLGVRRLTRSATAIITIPPASAAHAGVGLCDNLRCTLDHAGSLVGADESECQQQQSLPGAYTGQSRGPVDLRGVQVNQQLLNFLQQNTQGMKYLMAVPSAMQGADYVITTGRPVLFWAASWAATPWS